MTLDRDGLKPPWVDWAARAGGRRVPADRTRATLPRILFASLFRA